MTEEEYQRRVKVEATPVLDHGFVRLVDHMGDDGAICRAARVSTGTSTDDPEKDRRLIRRLVRDRHTSPLEMVELVYHIRAPIFVREQWLRHRTAHPNVESGRYRELRTDCHTPARFRSQHPTNRQMSGPDLPDEDQRRAAEQVETVYAVAAQAYRALLGLGVAREQARMVLPLALYSEWYWKIDLHNLLHFLALRLADDAQAEMRAYAEVVLRLARGVAPVAVAAWEDLRDGGGG